MQYKYLRIIIEKRRHCGAISGQCGGFFKHLSTWKKPKNITKKNTNNSHSTPGKNA